jgi:hypothetical protein
MKTNNLREKSFQTILEEKMHIPRGENYPSTDSVISYELFTNLSHILSMAPPLKCPFSNTPYKKTPQKTPKIFTLPAVTTQPKEQPTELSFLISNLSAAAQLALGQLQVNIESDGLHVKISEIKRAYRKMAKSHHPDLNPTISGDKFKQYKELSQLILLELKSSVGT